MADGFKIADAYVEVEARLDRAAFQRHLEDVTVKVSPKVETKSSKTLGKSMGAGMLLGIGDSFATGFVKTITAGIAGTGTSLSSALASNPYVAAAGMALAGGIVAVAAPAIGAGLAAAISSGAGLGIIAGGIALIKDHPLVKKAASELGRTLFDIDTTDLKDRAAAAQATLTDALKSGNKDRIKEARANLAEIRKELAKAEAFNENNFSLKDAARPLVNPAVESLKVLQKTAQEVMPEINDLFREAAPGLTPLAQGLGDLVKNALPGFRDLVKSSIPLLTTLGEGFGTFGKALSIFSSDVAGGGEGANLFLKDFIRWATGTIITVGKVINWLSKAYTAVRGFFTSIPGWLDTAGRWFTNTGATVQRFFTNTSTWFSELPGKVLGFLQALPDRLTALFSDMMNKAAYTVGYGVGAVLGYFYSLPGRAWTAVSSLPARIASVFTSARSMAVSLVSDLVASVVGTLKTLAGKSWEAIKSTPDRIKSVFSGAKSLLFSVGGDIISGLIQGIKDKLGALWSLVKSVAGGIKDGFESALQIGSPSKLMADKVGRWIPPGIVRGAEQAMPAAVNDIKGLVPGLTSAARGGTTATPDTADTGRQIVVDMTGASFYGVGSARQFVADLYDQLNRYEKGYAR